jgi:hypothetical protein
LSRNDEGEFELVLGNRQLISVFLIVVILLGVFFSMGYIVGRNSTPGITEVAARSGPAKSATERPVESTPPASSEPAPAPAPAETKPAKAEPVTTHPVQPAEAADATPAPSKPAPIAPAKEKKSPAPPPSERASVTGEPPTGDYWQVVATTRPDAEIVSEALTKKGFHALVAPAPKEGYFRVLVGPLKDSSTQAETRTNLESAGFRNPIMRKY